MKIKANKIPLSTKTKALKQILDTHSDPMLLQNDSAFFFISDNLRAKVSIEWDHVTVAIISLNAGIIDSTDIYFDTVTGKNLNISYGNIDNNPWPDAKPEFNDLANIADAIHDYINVWRPEDY